MLSDETIEVLRNGERLRGYMLRSGGKWLGAARTWLQWNRINGERVTWGSDDVLEPHFTARDVEELAAEVAAAAMTEAARILAEPEEVDRG